MTEYNKSLEEPGMFMSDEIRSQVLHAEDLFDRSVYCMDLSAYATSIRENIGCSMA